MLNKKIKKILVIISVIISVFLIINIPINSKAFDVEANLGSLDDYGKVSDDSSTEFTKRVGVIVTIVQVAGSIISVICLIVLGIKYMTGSVEQKAQYKKTLLPYVIGAGLLFATTNILGIIYSLATQI